MVVDESGKITVVIDWKSDVAPTGEQRERYRRQVRDYLAVTRAQNAMLVYVSLLKIDSVGI